MRLWSHIAAGAGALVLAPNYGGEMRIGLLTLLLLAGAAAARAEVPVTVTYLEHQVERPPTLSNLDPVPADLALAGARLGLADNATTGGFLGHVYALETTVVPPSGDVAAAARAALAGSRILVVNAPAETLLAVADLPEAASALIFNVSAPEDRLRDRDCRSNVLHAIASYGMRADALAQFMKKRRWTDWALVEGPQPADRHFAEALRSSARKFGLKVVDEAPWDIGADIRRNAAQEVPLFTQPLADHDLLVITDEAGDFGRYFLFNTALPRPVAGSEGLKPVTWSPVVEQWGAAQLQNRFRDLAGRPMRSEDYAAWAALRSVGEAVTRTGGNDPAGLRAFILSKDFGLAGQKGRPMSYRTWNGQLRQPLPLVHGRAVAAVAPIEGFLHQRTEMDSLGLDKPQSACRAFAEDESQ